MQVLEICSVWDIADLRITGLPQLQVCQGLAPRLCNADRGLQVLTMSLLQAMQTVHL